MNDVRIFRGSDNPGMLREIEAFRLYVWSRLIDAEVAARRFSIDPFDYAGWHVVHLGKDAIIASSRLIIAAEESQVPERCSFGPYLRHMRYPMGILNRLVVHPEHSGNGLGRRLNVARIELAARQGVDAVWVEVQTCRLASMRGLGFEDMGPSQDTTIDGDWRIMRKLT